MVGWMPTVLSKSSLVIPFKMATANPWVTYPALGPKKWKPMILLSSYFLQTTFA